MKGISRRNHYVPISHQKPFVPIGDEKLHYLNIYTDKIKLPDGRIKHHRAIYEHHPSQCFYQTDLYSTYFDTYVYDEIEQKLFGEIDTRSSNAIQAFLGDEISTWHENFENFFIYLDAQKFRELSG